MKKELEVLINRLEENTTKYENVESEISELSNYLLRLEDEHNTITKEIKKIEKKLSDVELAKIDNLLTGDEFRDAFIKCSYFCKKYCTENELYQYVIITKDFLLALDGYKALKVQCNSIPDKLKNTLIKWDVRANFKDNIEDSINKDLIELTCTNIDEIITKVKNFNDNIINCTLEELKSKYLVEIKNDEPATLLFKYKENSVGLNKEYYNILSVVFRNEKATIYYPKTPYAPLLINNKNQLAILMPIKTFD